jgi:phosphonate transport system substrate-binding protein
MKLFKTLSLLVAVALLALAVPASAAYQEKTFTIGAIPDQDPEKLNRLYGKLADYLSKELKVKVVYKPVQDYAASVTAFKVGDLQMVWFGGLTGVQARLQVDGAQAILQRDIDAEFRSVFIVNKATGLKPLEKLEDLSKLKGLTFTFGSESSTSGRLMPQFFLGQAGLNTTQDFKGKVGFSGSHDATIKLVEAGSFDAGALNAQVWDARVKENKVDTKEVSEIFRSPTYYDYHWVIRPDVEKQLGTGFTKTVVAAFTKLSAEDKDQKEILDLFGAKKFITTENKNYAGIEKVGREIGLIVADAKPTAAATMAATPAATPSK